MTQLQAISPFFVSTDQSADSNVSNFLYADASACGNADIRLSADPTA